MVKALNSLNYLPNVLYCHPGACVKALQWNGEQYSNS